MNPGPEKLLNCCLLNARSLRNKTTSFIDFVQDGNYDLVAVTKTWLNPDTASMISDITPHSYKLYHEPWQARRGGGVGFFMRNNLDFKVLPHAKFPASRLDSEIVNSLLKILVSYLMMRTPTSNMLIKFVQSANITLKIY